MWLPLVYGYLMKSDFYHHANQETTMSATLSMQPAAGNHISAFHTPIVKQMLSQTRFHKFQWVEFHGIAHF